MRPAPCAVDPKLRSSDFWLPSRIQLAVPIEPGIITGWPMLRYLLGTSHACRESPCGTLSVDHQIRGPLAINLVALHLGDIVCNIVNEIHAKVTFFCLEDLLKRFPRPMCYHLAVGPCEIESRIHCFAILPSLFGIVGQACKLSVSKRQPIFS